MKFAKKVIALCKKVPKNTISLELVAQVVRSSGSVGANYREANDALSKKDFVYRMKICRKEAKETGYWLELLKEANPDFEGKIELLLNEPVELRKIFSSIIERSK